MFAVGLTVLVMLALGSGRGGGAWFRLGAAAAARSFRIWSLADFELTRRLGCRFFAASDSDSVRRKYGLGCV